MASSSPMIFNRLIFLWASTHVLLNCVFCDQVVDVYIPHLAQAVHSADALLQAHGVPRRSKLMMVLQNCKLSPSPPDSVLTITWAFGKLLFDPFFLARIPPIKTYGGIARPLQAVTDVVLGGPVFSKNNDFVLEGGHELFQDIALAVLPDLCGSYQDLPQDRIGMGLPFV